MTHTKDNIALVDVPEGYQFRGLLTDIDPQGICFVKDRVDRCMVLPHGSWRFACLSTEMTEEKAREVVECRPYGKLNRWKNYKSPEFLLFTAIESFTSLLTALGCDPAGTYAVLVKND